MAFILLDVYFHERSTALTQNIYSVTYVIKVNVPARFRNGRRKNNNLMTSRTTNNVKAVNECTSLLFARALQIKFLMVLRARTSSFDVSNHFVTQCYIYFFFWIVELGKVYFPAPALSSDQRNGDFSINGIPPLFVSLFPMIAYRHLQVLQYLAPF